MDGTRLAALLRGTAAMRSVRVVMVSGQAESMVELARQAGADAFVVKSELNTHLVPT